MFDPTHSVCGIRNFVEFLELCSGCKVIEYSLRPLTNPGDNYGSVFQAVEVKVVAKSDFEEAELLHLVAKTAVTNPYLVDIFQPALTFVKETHFYLDVIPAIEHFERISNVPECDRIDAFIRCFGSRISLNPGFVFLNAKCADADAVVLLENTKLLNYVNGDRQVGFNAEETLAILKTLAKFHALGIAIRRLQPTLFDARVSPSPYLEAANLILNDDDTQMVDLNTHCSEGILQ
ncbi:uncharacterized protein LOC129564935 [Sitodiplosis mosellana]|uniref:uncharacterized protein LOC129564935 n=1 Tax=Sitodiplosis mosellana TaxID=263140 RepID=UPI00244426EE|nr:uncharacterized protein LOC129564935 [Sitodiplosis mosellana]